jgi:hypothetical protein
MIYTGIGSRDTPTHILSRMTAIARQLSEQGWILRSGGADGADSAFEKGALSVGGQTEIFLPWKGFNGNNSLHWEPPDEAYIIASGLHPVWDKLKDTVKRLHARNCQQVLGPNLDTPSHLVIAYTKNGENVGGTATAIKLAAKHSITIVNMGSPDYSEDKLWAIVALIEIAIAKQSNKELSQDRNNVKRSEYYFDGGNPNAN